LADPAKNKPFHEPPIQSRHWGYAVALQLVRAAVTRFHRIEGVEGIEHLTRPETPTIVVSNHQNGLMDPLVLVSLINQSQVHWLTRADVFNQKIARKALFAFNQMPIYRQRDRVSDARERNNRIFEICAERLRIGGRMGLFPEGNHRAMKALRPLRRGISDMVNAGIKLDPTMREMCILPVGIDYEEMPSFRRRLRYRIGKPIKVDTFIDPETNEVAPGPLLQALSKSMDEVLVNIQPEKAYDDLLPFVQAMRTTERDDWRKVKAKLDCFKDLSDEALTEIQTAAKGMQDAGVLRHARAEDLGMDEDDVRRSPFWFWFIAPIALIGGITSLPLAKWIEIFAKKRVKDPCFVSTSKVSSGMFLFPVYWIFTSVPLAYLAAGEVTLTAVLMGYVFQAIGSRIAGWWYGLYLDHRGRKQAKLVWKDAALRQSWKSYLNVVEHSGKMAVETLETK